MSDRPVCSYCRCELNDFDEAFCGGLCSGCMLDWLKEHPTEGYSVRTDYEGHHEYAFLCPRCGGSGHVYASARTPDTYCYSCEGFGYIVRTREGVQRTGRWWGTYQANRVPETRP